MAHTPHVYLQHISWRLLAVGNCEYMLHHSLDPRAAVVLLEENMKSEQKNISFGYPWGPSLVLFAHTIVIN
jgi:hypothetical protein